MSFLVERFTEKPVVLSRTLEDYDMATEQMAIQAAVKKHLDAAEEKLFYIVDLSHTKFDFQAILTGTNVAARMDTSTWRHENVRELIFVSPEPIMHRVSQGMNSEAFGYLQNVVFNTMEEAMEHIDEQLQASS